MAPEFVVSRRNMHLTRSSCRVPLTLLTPCILAVLLSFIRPDHKMSGGNLAQTFRAIHPVVRSCSGDPILRLHMVPR